MFTKGEDRVLYIKINNEYLPIGCLTGDSFSESSEMLDTTTRDNAGWKTSTPTLQSYNISFDGLAINTSDLGGDQTKISYDRLTLLKRNKTLIEWKSQDTLGVFVSVGKGYITELSDSSEIDGFISFNASIIGYGKPGDITDTYFTTTWRTTTPNETVTIPTNSSYTYNYNIRTSDGQFFTGVTGNNRVFTRSAKVSTSWWQDSQGCLAFGASGNRKNLTCQSSRRRSRRTISHYERC